MPQRSDNCVIDGNTLACNVIPVDSGDPSDATAHILSFGSGNKISNNVLYGADIIFAGVGTEITGNTLSFSDASGAEGGDTGVINSFYLGSIEQFSTAWDGGFAGVIPQKNYPSGPCVFKETDTFLNSAFVGSTFNSGVRIRGNTAGVITLYGDEGSIGDNRCSQITYFGASGSIVGNLARYVRLGSKLSFNGSNGVDTTDSPAVGDLRRCPNCSITGNTLARGGVSSAAGIPRIELWGDHVTVDGNNLDGGYIKCMSGDMTHAVITNNNLVSSAGSAVDCFIHFCHASVVEGNVLASITGIADTPYTSGPTDGAGQAGGVITSTLGSLSSNTDTATPAEGDSPALGYTQGFTIIAKNLCGKIAPWRGTQYTVTGNTIFTSDLHAIDIIYGVQHVVTGNNTNGGDINVGTLGPEISDIENGPDDKGGFVIEKAKHGLSVGDSVMIFGNTTRIRGWDLDLPSGASPGPGSLILGEIIPDLTSGAGTLNSFDTMYGGGPKGSSLDSMSRVVAVPDVDNFQIGNVWYNLTDSPYGPQTLDTATDDMPKPPNTPYPTNALNTGFVYPSVVADSVGNSTVWTNQTNSVVAHNNTAIPASISGGSSGTGGIKYSENTTVGSGGHITIYNNSRCTGNSTGGADVNVLGCFNQVEGNNTRGGDIVVKGHFNVIKNNVMVTRLLHGNKWYESEWGDTLWMGSRSLHYIRNTMDSYTSPLSGMTSRGGLSAVALNEDPGSVTASVGNSDTNVGPVTTTTSYSQHHRLPAVAGFSGGTIKMMPNNSTGNVTLAWSDEDGNPLYGVNSGWSAGDDFAGEPHDPIGNLIAGNILSNPTHLMYSTRLLGGGSGGNQNRACTGNFHSVSRPYGSYTDEDGEFVPGDAGSMNLMGSKMNLLHWDYTSTTEEIPNTDPQEFTVTEHAKIVTASGSIGAGTPQGDNIAEGEPEAADFDGDSEADGTQDPT